MYCIIVNEIKEMNTTANPTEHTSKSDMWMGSYIHPFEPFEWETCSDGVPCAKQFHTCGNKCSIWQSIYTFRIMEFIQQQQKKLKKLNVKKNRAACRCAQKHHFPGAHHSYQLHFSGHIFTVTIVTLQPRIMSIFYFFILAVTTMVFNCRVISPSRTFCRFDGCPIRLSVCHWAGAVVFANSPP